MMLLLQAVIPMRLLRLFIFLLVLISPTLGVRPVLAAPPAKTSAAEASARELKAKGDRAMDEARPSEALSAYEQSYALKPDPALLYNQARAHMALTNFPAALQFLQRFDREAPATLKAKVVGIEGLIKEVQGKVHRLTLVVDVPGAQIRLRDATLGQSPLTGPIETNAGPASLDVRAPGYKPVHRNLELAGNAASTEVVKLQRLDLRGTVVLRSPQPGVQVTVQGKAKGSLPLELLIAQGTYPVRLTKEGYETLDTSVVVVAGERRERSLTLAKKPALYTRWWFWTGIGVVAAGAAVTIFALTTERSPDSGTIPPGQVASTLSF